MKTSSVYQRMMFSGYGKLLLKSNFYLILSHNYRYL